MPRLRRLTLFTIFAGIVLLVFYQTKLPAAPFAFSNHQSIWGKDGSIPTAETPDAGKRPFKWSELRVQHPVTAPRPLPTDAPHSLPNIQHPFGTEPESEREIRERRRAEVRRAFERCWKSYKEYAWMKDELAPLTGLSKNPFGGWAATLIDSLDTLYIMDMKNEFEEAVQASLKVDFSKTTLESVNVFETTIRHLGGFLSAYDLSGDERIREKAVEVGEMLYVAFDTPNRMPLTRWNLHKAKSGEPQEAWSRVLVAELGSLSMEFTRLSQITGNSKWYDAIARITDLLEAQQNDTSLPGMWPIMVNGRANDLTSGSVFTLGAMSDSLYEYFPKMHILLGGAIPTYEKLYRTSMATAINHTLYRPMTPENLDILMSGAVHILSIGPLLDHECQHLVCFAGGMFGLGGRLFGLEDHVQIGRKLTDACIWAYKSSPLGIMPEISHLLPCDSVKDCAWNESRWKDEVLRRAKNKVENGEDPQIYVARENIPKGFTSMDDKRYILRPEAIESVFILYRITGHKPLQDAAWDMFQAIQRHTQTDIGNAAVIDVTVRVSAPQKSDSMESFWMAETLKYFYLVFSEPSFISLDQYVFNTEAHPFRRPR